MVSSKLKILAVNTSTVRTTSRTPMRLRAIPAQTILRIGTCPLAKTIALGGVATGSINANDADSAAGIIIKSGGIPFALAILAMIGSRTLVVAMLDVNSVKNVTSSPIPPTIDL